MCHSHKSEDSVFDTQQKLSKEMMNINEDYYKDSLMISTKILKQKLEYLTNFQKSTFYKILVKTTQPAHLIIILAVLSIAFSMHPGKSVAVEPSSFINLLYLGSFAMHLGAQIWMTFISGLSLYFALPRHSFCEVQKVLFPRYFLLNSILSFITLTIFLNHHNTALWIPEVFTQIIAMMVCFLTELIIRLYLTPCLLNLMMEKTEMEKEAGVGTEIGEYNPGVLKNSQEYIITYRKFRKIHMKIAIGNIVTMACTVVHLHYLSNKICVL